MANKKDKVLTLVDRIEKDLRKLAEATGNDYISVFLLDGSFNMDNGHGNGTLDVYRNGKYNSFTWEENKWIK